MISITNLFDQEFINNYFRSRLLPLYPKFSAISRVSIHPYKKGLWNNAYHLVIAFHVHFLTPDKQEEIIPIICAAHSHEDRRQAFSALSYLWSHDFTTENFVIPRPLFFDENFRAFFYRALSGKNFLYYIKQGNSEEIIRLAALSGRLFSRLHSLPAASGQDFNSLNSRIETIVPGKEKAVKDLASRYNATYAKRLESLYDILIEKEAARAFLEKKLIHGDAHSENIIITPSGCLGLIDFSDMCLADPARDLASFSRQLEYKIISKLGDHFLATAAPAAFLDAYLEASSWEMDENLAEGLKIYRAWTDVRTAIYWFLRQESDERRALGLLESAEKELGI